MAINLVQNSLESKLTVFVQVEAKTFHLAHDLLVRQMKSGRR